MPSMFAVSYCNQWFIGYRAFIRDHPTGELSETGTNNLNEKLSNLVIINQKTVF